MLSSCTDWMKMPVPGGLRFASGMLSFVHEGAEPAFRRSECCLTFMSRMSSLTFKRMRNPPSSPLGEGAAAQQMRPAPRIFATDA